jgi:DnaJ-class molecular chaperone
VKKLENTVNTWTVCPECKGQGKKSRRISKKVLHYQMAVEQFEKSNGEGTALFVLKHTWIPA